MDVDLRVAGGRIVDADGVVDADLYVAGGRVAAVSSRPLAVSARRTLQLSGELVWPGFIDAHVHFADPGYTEREDFASGTSAALAGGITTVVEMPNTDPVVSNTRGLEAKLESIAPKALVDYGLWGGLVPGSIDDVRDLSKRGIRLFKGFMSAYRSRGLPRISDWDLLRALELSRELDVVVAVHAENHDMIEGASKALGVLPATRYGEDHPLLAEEEAVIRATLLAERVRGRLHVVHVSGGSIASHIGAARSRGVNVTAETCPHYLAFTDDDGRRRGPWLRCAPPLRSSDERGALWKRLLDGTIDVVVSDHSPSPPDAKRAGENDLMQATNGFPGVQTLVPYMLSSGVKTGLISPEALYVLCSANPARLAGLFPRKGALRPGSDADFVIADLDNPWSLSASELRYKHQWSPWTGVRFDAKVQRVFIRGVEAFADGEMRVDAGFGRFQPAGGSDDPPDPRGR